MHRLRNRLALLTTLAATATVLSVSAAPPASACAFDCGEAEMQLGIDTVPRINPDVYGHVVEVFARMRDNSDSCDFGDCDSPTGTIELYVDSVNSTPLASATLSRIDGDESDIEPMRVTGIHAGSPTLIVKYVPGGDAPFNATQQEFVDTVAEGPTRLGISISYVSNKFGNPITLGAVVEPVDDVDTSLGAHLPQGSVEMYLDGQLFRLVGVNSNGEAVTSADNIPVGHHTAGFRYAGDGDWKATPESFREFDVVPADATTGLTQTKVNTEYGEPFEITAVVTPGSGTVAPTGDLRLYDGNILESYGQLNNGTFTHHSEFLVAGTHTLTAAYGGDNNYNPSTSAAITHTVAAAATVTTLTSPTPNPSGLGDPVTLHAQVRLVSQRPQVMFGVVQFKDGSANLGAPVSLSPIGDADLVMTALAGGTHAITAVYLGDPQRFQPSTSSPLSRTVACTTLLTGSVPGNYSAGANGTTCLSNVTLGGSLSIPAGARVSIVNSTIGGTVLGGGHTILMCGSSVGGVLSLQGAGRVTIGDLDQGCTANTISGAAQLTNGTGGLKLIGNRLRANATVSGNTGGPVIVGGNTVGGRLSCTGNNPTATNGGRPNTATARSGECT
jgi:hypothetical protein